MTSDIKCVLVGDSNTGKSSLLSKQKDGSFSEHHISTVGTDRAFLELKVDDQKFKVEVWDTAGRPEFRPKVKSFFRGANIIFFMYDCTKPDSLEGVRKRIESLPVFEHQGKQLRVLLSNKNDLYS